MPSLTIGASAEPNILASISPSKKQHNNHALPPLQQVPPHSFSSSASATEGPANRPPSPVAPEYSPITPKAVPALPALPVAAREAFAGLERTKRHYEGQQAGYRLQESDMQHRQQDMRDIPQPTEALSILRPKPQPFSSEDSTDAIALRAAISALQFQKRKAQQDVRTLEEVRKLALRDPELFRGEVKAGRLEERRRVMGEGFEAVFKSGFESESEDEEHDEDDDKDGEGKGEEIPDSQPPTQPPLRYSPPVPAPFSKIPGPQDIVRMPPINWDKYHVNGAALNELHEQQRRWPGSVPYAIDKGREHSVAAPYSPWYDGVLVAETRIKEGEPGVGRKDSSISEHPMETRRGMSNHARNGS